MECLWSEGVVCKETIFQSIGFIWISAGIFMVIAELVIPGVFISFLGISAIITGLVLFVFEMKFMHQIYFWAILSAVLIFFGGKFMEKIFPSDKVVSDKIEDSYVGKIVKVTQKVTPEQAGRVFFQGTEWNAKSIGSEIEAGEYARIYDKENLTFIINKLSEEEKKGFSEKS